jgi:acyl-CoA hydrolase
VSGETTTPAVKSGTATVPAEVGQIVWLGAQVVMVGATVSRTVTVKEQVLVLRKTSLPVHVTVVTPEGKRLPEAGTQETEAVGSQALVTVVV